MNVTCDHSSLVSHWGRFLARSCICPRFGLHNAEQFVMTVDASSSGECGMAAVLKGTPGRTAGRAHRGGRAGRLRHRQHAVGAERRRGASRSRSGRATPRPEAKAFAHLVAEYEAQHPGQKVSTLFVNSDNTLQKVLTAVRGGSPPDIAYLYGSWAPNVAQIPQVVEPHPGGQAARRQLGRLLDRRARRGHRQRQGDRHPGRWWTTWPWSTTRSCSPRPGCSRRDRTGPGRSSWPTRRS